LVLIGATNYISSPLNQSNSPGLSAILWQSGPVFCFSHFHFAHLKSNASLPVPVVPRSVKHGGNHSGADRHPAILLSRQPWWSR